MAESIAESQAVSVLTSNPMCQHICDRHSGETTIACSSRNHKSMTLLWTLRTLDDFCWILHTSRARLDKVKMNEFYYKTPGISLRKRGEGFIVPVHYLALTPLTCVADLNNNNKVEVVILQEYSTTTL